MELPRWRSVEQAAESIGHPGGDALPGGGLLARSVVISMPPEPLTTPRSMIPGPGHRQPRLARVGIGYDQVAIGAI